MSNGGRKCSGQPWKKYIYRGTCQHCSKDLAIGKVKRSCKENEWVICGPKNGCGTTSLVRVQISETEAASPPERSIVVFGESAETQTAE